MRNAGDAVGSVQPQEITVPKNRRVAHLLAVRDPITVCIREVEISSDRQLARIRHAVRVVVTCIDESLRTEEAGGVRDDDGIGDRPRAIGRIPNVKAQIYAAPFVRLKTRPVIKPYGGEYVVRRPSRSKLDAIGASLNEREQETRHIIRDASFARLARIAHLAYLGCII